MLFDLRSLSDHSACMHQSYVYSFFFSLLLLCHTHTHRHTHLLTIISYDIKYKTNLHLIPCIDKKAKTVAKVVSRLINDQFKSVETRFHRAKAFHCASIFIKTTPLLILINIVNTFYRVRECEEGERERKH